MKKFVLFFIMINIINPSYAWFWDRKDKALDAELQGKGYAGTLPSLNLDLIQNSCIFLVFSNII